MIASFFEKTSLFSIIIVFLSLLGLCFLITFSEYGLHFESIEEGSLLFLTIGINLYMLLFIVKNQKLTLKNNYPAILFILITLSLFQNFIIDFRVFSTLFISLALFEIYGLHHHNTSIQKSIFNGSFWIGMATLLEFWNGLFLLLLIGAIFIINTNRTKHILMGLVGWVTPLFLGFTCLYCFTETSFTTYFLPQNFSFSLRYFNHFPNNISVFILLALLLIAFVFISPKAINIGKKFVTNWKILFGHLIIAIAITGFTLEKTIYNDILLAFPASIVLSILLQNIPKPVIKNVILFLFAITFLLQVIW